VCPWRTDNEPGRAVPVITEICSVCSKSFEVIFRYQMEERDGGFAFFCSQDCLGRSHGSVDADQSPMVTCDACSKRFALKLASQALYTAGRRRYACSMSCRSQLVRESSGARLHEFVVAPAAVADTAGPSDEQADGVESALCMSGPAPGALPAAMAPARPERPETRSAPLPAGALETEEPEEDDGGAQRELGVTLAATLEPAPQSAEAKPGVVARGGTRRGDRLGADVKAKVSRQGEPTAALWPPKRIAVFNHKGGTGKTTTSVSLAAGLAAAGKRVLLVDTDSQGNVAVSLGVSGERSLYHVLVMGLRVADAVRTVRPNLDVLPSNETLAAAELYLAGRQQRDRVLAQRMESAAAGYDHVIIDCSPSLSLMNQNALVFADSVLIPVGCDYLSLVGVRQVIKTVRNVNTLLHHRLQIWGVLPTFYDVRAKICTEALETLRSHFGDRCLPPVRATTRLKEAPAQAQSIFEYAPGTRGADDYQCLVDRVLGVAAACEDSGAPESADLPTRSSAGRTGARALGA
jgi:chromosome partitioning protein